MADYSDSNPVRPSYIGGAFCVLGAIGGLACLVVVAVHGSWHPLTVTVPLLFVIGGAFFFCVLVLDPLLALRDRRRQVLAFQEGRPVGPLAESAVASVLFLLMGAMFTVKAWSTAAATDSPHHRLLLSLIPVAITLLVLWPARMAVRFAVRRRHVRSWRLRLTETAMEPNQWVHFTITLDPADVATADVQVRLSGRRWHMTSAHLLRQDMIDEVDGAVELEPSPPDAPNVVCGKVRADGDPWNGDDSSPGSWIEPRLRVARGPDQCEFPLPLVLQGPPAP